MSDTSVAAVVFDFDGTIVDTETPVYESWRATFEGAGVEPIPRDVWAAQIGMADGDALDCRALLCERLGVPQVPVDVEQSYHELKAALTEAQPIRAGVVDWLGACDSAGVRLAVASSSPTSWVESNLRRLGLLDRFELLSCADPGVPGKPDPTVYRQACAALSVEPAAAIAIEDSTNGIAAAVAAGMRCIASPGPMTVDADLSLATLIVGSLADVDPSDWLTI